MARRLFVSVGVGVRYHHYLRRVYLFNLMEIVCVSVANVCDKQLDYVPSNFL